MTWIVRNRDWQFAALIFISVLSLYLWSMPGTIVLEDDGLFILAAWFNGIAHPPGYPLYTLLAHLVTHLPLPLTVAGRAHAFSALFGASACCMVSLITLRLTGHRLAAVVAGIGYGVSEVFWSQSIIAEVYSLNSLLFFLAVWLCLLFRQATDRPRLLYAAAFICGLGLANHWPLLILSGPLLLGIVWPWHWVTVRTIAIALLCLLSGLSPYLWMIVHSQMNPAISFYGPIDTLYEFWFVISRAGYAGVDESITAGWTDKLQFLVFFCKQFAAQFGPAGFVLVLIGLFYQRRYWSLSVTIGMLTAFFGNTVLLILMLGFDYDLIHQLVFRVYPHLAYGIAAIWMAVGFLVVQKFIGSHISASRIIATGLALLILAMGLSINLPLNYRANDTWTEKYARTVLDNLDRNTALFTYGEVTTAPLAYLNLIEEYRPDVEIFNGQGLVLANRLYSFNESEEVMKQKNDRFIMANDRPVYYMGDFANSYANYHYGLFLKVNKDARENFTVYRKDPKIYPDLLALVQTEPLDPWQNMTYRLLMVDYCKLSLHMLLSSMPVVSADDGRIDPRCRTYQGYMMMIEELQGLDKTDWNLLNALIERTVPLVDQATDKQSRSLLEYYRGLVLRANGEEAAVNQAFRRSIDIWPDPDNRAMKECSGARC